MTWPDASSGEMPTTSPVPGPAGPELDEQLLDAILAGQHLAPDAPEQAHAVAEILARLAGPADPGDLAAEAAVRSAFARAAAPTRPHDTLAHDTLAYDTLAYDILGRDTLGRETLAYGTQSYETQPGEPPPASRRRASWPPAQLSARLAAALAAVMIVLGGTVAAYAGALPGPIQELAHRTIDAPADRHHDESVNVTTPASRPTVSPPAEPTAPASQQRLHHRVRPKRHAKNKGKAKGHKKTRKHKKPKNHEKHKRQRPPGLRRHPRPGSNNS